MLKPKQHTCDLCAKNCDSEVTLIDHKFYFHKIPRPGSEKPDNLTNHDEVEEVSTVTIPESSEKLDIVINRGNSSTVTIPIQIAKPLTVPQSWSVTNPEQPSLTDPDPSKNVTVRPVIRYLVPINPLTNPPVSGMEPYSESSTLCQLCSKYFPEDMFEEHKEKCHGKYLGKTTKPVTSSSVTPTVQLPSVPEPMTDLNELILTETDLQNINENVTKLHQMIPVTTNVTNRQERDFSREINENVDPLDPLSITVDDEINAQENDIDILTPEASPSPMSVTTVTASQSNKSVIPLSSEWTQSVTPGVTSVAPSVTSKPIIPLSPEWTQSGFTNVSSVTPSVTLSQTSKPTTPQVPEVMSKVQGTAKELLQESVCNICKKTFQGLDKLVQHLQVDHGKKNVKIVRKDLAAKPKMSQLLQPRTKAIPLLYPCSKCERSFKTQSLLLEHWTLAHQFWSHPYTKDPLALSPKPSVTETVTPESNVTIKEIDLPEVMIESVTPVTASINVTKSNVTKPIDLPNVAINSVTPVRAKITVTDSTVTDLDSSLIASMSATDPEPSVTGVTITPINENVTSDVMIEDEILSENSTRKRKQVIQTREEITSERPKPKTNEPTLFKCKVCPYSVLSNSEKALESHLSTHTSKELSEPKHKSVTSVTKPQEPKLFTCKVCVDSVFDSEEDVKTHLSTHSLKELQNHYKTLKSQVSGVSVTQVIHSEDKPKKYHCKVCQDSFETALDYIDHEHCPMCSKTFKGSKALKAHLETHPITDYKFGCKACNQGFLTKSNLEEHCAKVHPPHSKLSVVPIFGPKGEITMSQRQESTDFDDSDESTEEQSKYSGIHQKSQKPKIVQPEEMKKPMKVVQKVKCFACHKTFEKLVSNLPKNFKGTLLTKCSECVAKHDEKKKDSIIPVLKSAQNASLEVVDTQTMKIKEFPSVTLTKTKSVTGVTTPQEPSVTIKKLPKTKCSICCEVVTDVQAHMKLIHRPRNSHYSCHICHKSFNSCH